MSYLNYQEYLQLGGSLKEGDFERVIFKVENIINLRTMNKIKSISVIPKEVKLLEFELIPYINDRFTLDLSNLKSKKVKTGNVSQEETYEVKSLLDTQNYIYDMIYSYLYNLVDDLGNSVLFVGLEYD